MPLPFANIFGVDFSGARAAGNSTWIARLEPIGDGGRADPARLCLASLDRLADMAGSAEREPALRHIVGLVRASRAALWGFDCPFGLPIELFPPGTRWAEQLALLNDWPVGAYALGLECLRRARLVVERLHIRRATDVQAKTPFDCYHYRIIYQTFHGMRDIAEPLRRDRGTAVLPFQYRRWPTAERVVVETCPSSVLKRLGLPHRNYKQPAGGNPDPKRQAVRRLILNGLASQVKIPDRLRRVLLRDPGADALDAVLAALGAAHGMTTADHRAIARHPRYPREGLVYF